MKLVSVIDVFKTESWERLGAQMIVVRFGSPNLGVSFLDRARLELDASQVGDPARPHRLLPANSGSRARAESDVLLGGSAS